MAIKHLMLLSVMAATACAGGGDATINYTSLACSSTVDDSTFVSDSVQRIRSELVANSFKQVDTRGVTLNYMVHTAANPKALVILIAGGQLNSKLSGIIETPPSAVSFASGNFLVRSAHLFSAQGYKVVTINRPSDWNDFIVPSGSSSGSAFDSYRISSAHATDLQAVITAENSGALPVVIAGTSRGTISVVAQHGLAQYLLLSAPLTGGNKGNPVGSSAANPANIGDKPVHMIWHQSDACFVSTPADANRIAGNFSNMSAVQVSGGLNYPKLSSKSKNKECDGSTTYHGFLGIESCVVQNATSWLDAQLSNQS